MPARSGSSRFGDSDTVALLALVHDGDNDAFGELYVRYHDFAHRVAKKASRRHADDLVAEAFRRILTAISRGAGPTEAFGPYLATTIRSAAAGLAAPYQEVELTVSNELVDDHGDVDPRVSTAYVSLPEAWQNALWYSDVEGLSPRHAAPLMGLASANAFSALRQRARAGLRSAYLTQVVDDACNDEVRRHLELLAAGKTTPEVVDALVDEHLDECDQCGAIAWRIAAVTGSKVPIALAPALVAFHGFTMSPALLPAGLGQAGLLGWWRRSSQSAAVPAAVIVAALLLMLGLVYAAGREGDRASNTGTTTTTTGLGLGVADGGGSGTGAGDPGPESVAPPSAVPTTTSSSTTSSSTTTSTSVPRTTIATSLPNVTAPPRPTLPAGTVALTTIPAGTTTSTTPPTTTAAATTTTAPAATSTSTTSTSTTSTSTTSTTTTTTTTTTTSSTSTTSTSTTTTVPQVPPGDLVILQDVVIDSIRQIDLAVQDLTGDSGSIRFSRSVTVVTSSNLSCGSTVCTFGGVTAPDVVSAHVDSSPGIITIELLNSAGVVVGSYTSP